MMHILVAGANSFVGTSFEKYIRKNYSGDYIIDTIDMQGDAWRSIDFSKFDSIFYVAGIAHSDNGRISKEKAKLYYSVNTDLTIAAAKKAKADGVKQFIFMSSAIVYGNSAPIGRSKVINKDTLPTPANCYGDSKLQAERGILPLNDENFKVVILRPPMIYGKGSRGNYPLLSKIAQKVPIFPYVKNERSMLYIDNLSEFVRLMIENHEEGIFWPQNSEYVNTSELVKMIAEVHGKKVILVKGFSWLLVALSWFTGIVNKAFGSFTYSHILSYYKNKYSLISLQQSILNSEGRND